MTIKGTPNFDLSTEEGQDEAFAALMKTPDVCASEEVDLADAADQVERVMAVTDDEISNFESLELAKIYHLDFDVLAIELASNMKHLERILARLEIIAEEEELEISVQRSAGQITVDLVKKEDVVYCEHMELKNAEFLAKLPYTIVCLEGFLFAPR